MPIQYTYQRTESEIDEDGDLRQGLAVLESAQDYNPSGPNPDWQYCSDAIAQVTGPIDEDGNMATSGYTCECIGAYWAVATGMWILIFKFKFNP